MEGIRFMRKWSLEVAAKLAEFLLNYRVSAEEQTSLALGATQVPWPNTVGAEENSLGQNWGQLSEGL